MHILAVLCSHFTKQQHNITEFPSLSAGSNRVCEHVGNAAFKKVIDSFDKSFIFAVCTDYYILLAVYISIFGGKKMHADISPENSETWHCCKGEHKPFIWPPKTLNRKTLLNFVPFHPLADNKNTPLKNQWGVMELDPW